MQRTVPYDRKQKQQPAFHAKAEIGRWVKRNLPEGVFMSSGVEYTDGLRVFVTATCARHIAFPAKTKNGTPTEWRQWYPNENT